MNPATPATPPGIEISGIFPAEFRCLEDVCALAGRAAQQCGFSEDDVYHVQIAVDEAFSNIIEHALEGTQGQQVECTCLVSDTALTITLSDYGKSFNPEEVPGPLLDRDLHEREKGGLGLFFIRHWMDEVHFESVASRNVLVMVKRKESSR